jgi:hypothetical protein
MGRSELSSTVKISRKPAALAFTWSLFPGLYFVGNSMHPADYDAVTKQKSSYQAGEIGKGDCPPLFCESKRPNLAAEGDEDSHT